MSAHVYVKRIAFMSLVPSETVEGLNPLELELQIVSHHA